MFFVIFMAKYQLNIVEIWFEKFIDFFKLIALL